MDFLENIQIVELIDFQQEIVFIGIARQTCIYLIRNTYVQNNLISIKHDVLDKYEIVPQEFYLQLKNYALKTNVSYQDVQIFSKLLKDSILLGSLVCINTGVVAHSRIGASRKFTKDDVIFKEYKKGYKKYITGSNISQYLIKYENDYIDYDGNINDFHRPKYSLLFESEKIIIRRISGSNNRFFASYDDLGYYTNDNIMHMVKWNEKILNFQKPENKWEIKMHSEVSLKLILAIINSKLNTYYFSKFLSTDTLQGSYSSIYPEDIRQIPIKEIDLEIQNNIIILVDKVMSMKKVQIDTTELEAEIDKMVYELYGLTQDEIKVVEGNN